MRTIGDTLKEARARKKYSRAKIEKETKIKKEFIEAIEKEEWGKLPEYPVVQGFVKSIAGSLNVEQKQIIALLRRDYPPKQLSINPKPDAAAKFVWSPKFTFITGVLVAALGIFIYLGVQYKNFVAPPQLEVENPKDNETIEERYVVVSGKTDPEVVVKINNQPVLVNEDGRFVSEIEIFEGTHEIEIKAISRAGKETLIRRKIIPKLDE